MTDPSPTLLTRLRTATYAMQAPVRMPASKLKEALAAILSARRATSRTFSFRDEPSPTGPYAGES